MSDVRCQMSNVKIPVVAHFPDICYLFVKNYFFIN